MCHVVPLERPETVAFVWPEGKPAPDYIDLDGHVVRFAVDRQAFARVQAAIGWRVCEDQWNALTRDLVPDSMVFIETGGASVATACALARDDGWAELAWVAVDARHRGKRLGQAVCTAVVSKLLRSGRTHIFGSTQDSNLHALRIYMDLGFHPVQRKGKAARWLAICDQLGHPFAPRLWGWQSHED